MAGFRREVSRYWSHPVGAAFTRRPAASGGSVPRGRRAADAREAQTVVTGPVVASRSALGLRRPSRRSAVGRLEDARGVRWKAGSRRHFDRLTRTDPAIGASQTVNVVTGPMSTFARVILVAWNVTMSAVCITMFTWIVHDRRMPGWPDTLDRAKHARWWMSPVAICRRRCQDVLIVAAFGLMHAGAARRSLYAFTEKIGVPRQALRTVFMTVTATAWLGVMFFWQPTGVVVFDSRPALAAADCARSCRHVWTVDPVRVRAALPVGGLAARSV